MKKNNSISEIEVLPLTDGEPVKIIHNLRNYLAGQAHGITRDSALLEEVIKIYFCHKFSDKSDKKKQGNDPVELSKTIRQQFQKIVKRFNNFYDEDEQVLLDPLSIAYVIQAFDRIDHSTKRQIDLVAHLYEAFIGEDIKGKDGQFFTPKVAVDFLVDAVSPQPNWKIADTACGAASFLCSSAIYLQNTDPNSEGYSFTGIDKDARLVRLAKIHLALLTGNNDVDVRAEDSLKDFTPDQFDLIVTNPPFGTKIIAATGETLKKYDLGHKWVQEKQSDQFIKTTVAATNVPPQVLFMERNIRALKAGGTLATVIPESLISSKNYKYVVQYILENCYIDGVFGMPESLFKISGKGGTHTKTVLLILRKKADKAQEQNTPIFMGEALWCGHDSRGNSIPNNDLPEMLLNYKKFKSGEVFTYTQKSFLLSIDDLDDLLLSPRSYDLGFEESLKKIRQNCDMITIRQLVDAGYLQIRTGDEVGKLAYGGGIIPYVRTSDISNWEIKEDAKQKVSEEVYASLANKQDVQAGDILMVKDGTYLIGTLGIVTDADTKIVYQSHVYKIRVSENEYGIDSYNLLALLSSNFVQKQIKNKRQTQDVIDSLGRRIYDLLLPLPHNRNSLKDISQKTKKIIDMKQATKQQMRGLQTDSFFS